MDRQVTAASGEAPRGEDGRKPALVMKGLRKNIGPVRIFSGLDLELMQGEILAVLGPRKSGKTHLLRAAAKLMPVDSGVVDARGAKTGFMPAPPGTDRFGHESEPGMFPRTTVTEHLDFLAACARVPRAKRHGIVRDVLALMDLETCSGMTAARLTKTQKARLLFAGTVLRDPGILLLDDPLPSFSDDLDVFWAISRELAGMGKSIMLSTCDPRLLAGGPDRIAVLYGGTIAFAGGRDAALARVAAAGWPPPQAFFGGVMVKRHPVRRAGKGKGDGQVPLDGAAGGPDSSDEPAAGAKTDAPAAPSDPVQEPLLPSGDGPITPDQDVLPAAPPAREEAAPVMPPTCDGSGQRHAPKAAQPRSAFSLKSAAASLLLQAARLPGPLFWNDMRIRLAKSRRFPWVSGAFAALCVLVLAAGLPGPLSSATLGEHAPGRVLFFTHSVIMMIAVAVFSPSFSATGFIDERNRRTFDLLASSGLTPLELVGGKFLSSLALTMAVCFAGAPSMFVALSLGGVPLTEAPKHALLYFSTAAAVCSVGVVISMLLRSAALSVFITCLLSVFLFVVSVVAAAIAHFIAQKSVGVPYPGFWAVASALNAVTTLLMLAGATIAFRTMARWDY